jgi:hypothetical protein
MVENDPVAGIDLLGMERIPYGGKWEWDTELEKLFDKEGNEVKVGKGDIAVLKRALGLVEKDVPKVPVAVDINEKGYKGAGDNCYTYACGNPASEEDDYKPGNRKGGDLGRWNTVDENKLGNTKDRCSYLEKMVKVDNDVVAEIKGGGCPCGYTLIRLFVTRSDYHFTKKADGIWSGKFGRNGDGNITPVKGLPAGTDEAGVDLYVESFKKFGYKSCNKNLCVRPKK